MKFRAEVVATVLPTTSFPFLFLSALVYFKYTKDERKTKKKKNFQKQTDTLEKKNACFSIQKKNGRRARHDEKKKGGIDWILLLESEKEFQQTRHEHQRAWIH